MQKIFVIEDDVVFREELSKSLRAYGYECTYSDDYEHMADEAVAAGADLILLDLNLPIYDGQTVCHQIRNKSQVPIIVLTSQENPMSEVMSLKLGADDFVHKPFHLQILLARIDAVLKRSGRDVAPHALGHKGVMLDMATASATCKNKRVELTKNEIRILALLMSRAGSIVTRDELMEALWQSDAFVDENTLTVNINRLRKKLLDIGVDDYIITRRGQGYMV